MFNVECLSTILKTKATPPLIVVLRHAEKATPSKGALLSEKGISLTKQFGKMMCSLNQPLQIYSSPELRCVQTANIISQTADWAGKKIILTHNLGEPGIQVRDNQKYLELYAAHRCRDIYTQWKEGSFWDILFSPDELLKKATIFFNKTCNACGITCYISQSGTVAHLAYVYGQKNYQVHNNEWVDYLDGFFLELPDR